MDQEMADIDEFEGSSGFDVDDSAAPEYVDWYTALDNTFLGIPGLKRSPSPESADDEHDDTFSFLNTDVGHGNSPSAHLDSLSTLFCH
jgi:hypothetical protein